MGEKITISIQDIENESKKLSRIIKDSGWKPDVIIGLSRGGLIPAQYIAYNLEVLCIETISVQLRDTSFFKAEDEIKRVISKLKELNKPLNLLVVDDLIDSGKTLELINNSLQDAKFTVRTSALYQNISVLKANYYANEKPNGWLVFPWDIKE